MMNEHANKVKLRTMSEYLRTFPHWERPYLPCFVASDGYEVGLRDNLLSYPGISTGYDAKSRSRTFIVLLCQVSSKGDEGFKLDYSSGAVRNDEMEVDDNAAITNSPNRSKENNGIYLRLLFIGSQICGART